MIFNMGWFRKYKEIVYQFYFLGFVFLQDYFCLLESFYYCKNLNVNEMSVFVNYIKRMNNNIYVIFLKCRVRFWGLGENRIFQGQNCMFMLNILFLKIFDIDINYFE